MYYINSFLLYSVVGFVLESTLFKIVNINKHSGILYGPVTIVYGLGVLAMLLIDKYILKKINIKNKLVKLILTYIILSFFLTIVECLGGNIVYLLFKIDMWNYSNNFLHIGKYVCLRYFLIWGLLGLLFLNIIKPFMDKFIKKIPQFLTSIFLLVFVVDVVLVILTK